MSKSSDALLLAALVAGATLEDAANQCGMSRTTAWRRTRDPEFARQLEELRTEIVQRSADLLTAANVDAIGTLRSMLPETAKDGRPIPEQQRVTAAKAIIELGCRLRENAELRKQVAALKELVELSKAEVDGGKSPESDAAG